MKKLSTSIFGLLIGIVFVAIGGFCTLLGSITVLGSSNSNEGFGGWSVTVIGLALLGMGGYVMIQRLGLLKSIKLRKGTPAVNVVGTDWKFQNFYSLDDINSLDPIAFERFTKQLFEGMGYKVDMTATTGDEGIDLHMYKDDKKVVVQCKQYTGSVGQSAIRDLYGAMMHEQAQEAYLVTTGSYTEPAVTWAEGKPIRLIDGKQLESWMEKFG